MGGLIGRMKITSVTFIIGTAALCGIYPLSGFYSKDAVMVVTQNKPLLLYVGCFVAFLTSFYTTRLCVVVFFGKSRSWASEVQGSINDNVATFIDLGLWCNFCRLPTCLSMVC